MFLDDAQNFMKSMPYKTAPYNGRNWGSPWHSLCSYHGKLKPSIAHFLISNFTKEGDIVLDPLCGVGTIPLEACLQGRIGIGNDLSELAYVVTKAKLEISDYNEVLIELNILDSYIQEHKYDFTGTEYADFGFNGKLPSYFHPDTYKEILAGRKYFLSILNNITAPQAMLYSAFLHVLHGNRPYALSRKSHSLTPYAPQGEFEYKKVTEKIRNKIDACYSKNEMNNYIKGQAIFGDYTKLTNSGLKVDAIICSPPFADSIRFYMQNWMRLWLCGWNQYDYKTAEQRFLDKKQSANFDVYYSFFQMCNTVLKENGIIVLHLGKTNKYDMAQELSKRAEEWFNVIYSANENVSEIEKHGIKDKGATLKHQFLFLQKKIRQE